MGEKKKEKRGEEEIKKKRTTRKRKNGEEKPSRGAHSGAQASPRPVSKACPPSHYPRSYTILLVGPPHSSRAPSGSSHFRTCWLDMFPRSSRLPEAKIREQSLHPKVATFSAPFTEPFAILRRLMGRTKISSAKL